jgi:ribonuclease HII
MILAGIDEAGYGPLLGPLCVGCCALRVTGDDADMNLWKVLSRAVSAKSDATGRKLHVNDSKKVYTPSAGVASLELSVLAFLRSVGTPIDDWAALLAGVCGAEASALLECPWYAEPASHPMSASSDAISIAANALSREMSRAGVGVARIRCFAIPEKPLNAMLEATRNKSSTSFTFVARHIDALMQDFAGERLVIDCDRQGGRTHYAAVLRTMFPDWSLSIESESEAAATYELSAGARRVLIRFREKAETHSLCVAMASMTAKYLREACMARFNVYWQRQVPGVKPTAGYWTDGQRFVSDLRAAGIDPPGLERSR